MRGFFHEDLSHYRCIKYVMVRQDGVVTYQPWETGKRYV